MTAIDYVVIHVHVYTVHVVVKESDVPFKLIGGRNYICGTYCRHPCRTHIEVFIVCYLLNYCVRPCHDNMKI